MAKQLFGLITPRRDFIACGRYKHAQKALELRDSHAEFAAALDGIQLLFDAADAARQSCEQIAGADGDTNAEWHLYEMAKDDAFADVWVRLLAAGFIRVGTTPDSRTCCFEGRPQVLQQQHAFCNRLAADFNPDMRCKFEPQPS